MSNIDVLKRRCEMEVDLKYCGLDEKCLEKLTDDQLQELYDVFKWQLKYAHTSMFLDGLNKFLKTYKY